MVETQAVFDDLYQARKVIWIVHADFVLTEKKEGLLPEIILTADEKNLGWDLSPWF